VCRKGRAPEGEQSDDWQLASDGYEWNPNAEIHGNAYENNRWATKPDSRSL